MVVVRRYSRPGSELAGAQWAVTTTDQLAEVPPRYCTTYFAHVWGGGYAAGYYAYLWSEVLDHDTYYWFREHGGMTRENGQRFRDMVLSRGSTKDMAQLYRDFRGRDPEVEPLLEQRGLKAMSGGDETAGHH